MTEAAWAPLRDEFDRWAALGRAAPLWLRDDDAIEPTPALDHLLGWAGRFGLPLTLAVIPAGATPALAERLSGETRLRVAVHGWDHASHAPAGEKKQELGAHRAADVVLADLARGRARLGDLFGSRLVDLLVPPWNRIAPDVVAGLAPIGFRALSVYGPEKPGPLPQVNTHVDLMDWHGTRGARPVADLVADLVARLAVVRDGAGACGILTHHLVHDDAAWAFLDELAAHTVGHPGCRWLGIEALMPPVG